MKKIFAIIFILSITFQPIVSFAQENSQTKEEDPYWDKSSEKLKRGMTNVVACYGELSKSFGETYEDDGFMSAISFGVLKGAVLTIRRAAVGAVETITFFVPNDPILEEPLFIED